jgi:preprotein translocase subunit SecD
MHPSRYLIVLAAIFVVLYALVFFTGPGTLSHWQGRLKPKLGLDLVGGTTLTLIASEPGGKTPSAANLEEARQIIENRVNGLGVSEPEVVTQGNNQIVVSVAGQNNDAIKQVGETARLRFRQVVNSVQDTSQASASPSPSASKSATPSGSASASASASAKASASATPSASASSTPSSSASATPSASASASASSSSGSNQPVLDSAQAKALLAKVETKLGAAYQLAGQLQSPTDAQQLGAYLDPFAKLSPLEVSVLPTSMQLNVPQVGCKQLNNRPTGSIDPINDQVVACGEGYKYLLDKATVVGTDVKSANYTYDSTQGGWKVTLSFKGNGQNKWTNLTKKAYGQTAPANQVAITLDNDVVSAPAIQSVISGDAEITGSFTQDQAKVLSTQLNYGALPLNFTQGTAESISATLGTTQLEAGLIAAAIGMLIVIIYSLFYYRLLGIVIFLSLALSGLLVFGALIMLGRQLGLTLTLAGFAGFVVSLGVAADSFVIYFERLKDEIRDGRTPRSAVPRAWARARRTIISANTITIMCAAVLYFLSIGSVQGFAFALGVATLLDLVVVFLFRHPIMTLFARSRAFLSPRVSGLGRVLEHAGTDDGDSRRGRSSGGPATSKGA